MKVLLTFCKNPVLQVHSFILFGSGSGEVAGRMDLVTLWVRAGGREAISGVGPWVLLFGESPDFLKKSGTAGTILHTFWEWVWGGGGLYGFGGSVGSGGRVGGGEVVGWVGGVFSMPRSTLSV